MDWSKAKNYTIVFLVGLNIFLFVSNFLADRKYIMSSDSKTAISQLLNNNGITLSAELPKTYMPMRQMTIENYAYDFIQLQDIFLTDKTDIKRTREFDKTIISSENEKIIVYNNTVYYQNTDKENTVAFEKAAVLKRCGEYAAKISDAYYEMSLDYISKTNDGEAFIVEYFTKSGGYNIFSNYLRFTVKSDGSLYLEFKYGKIGKTYGSETDICSPDEALFVFMDSAQRLVDSSSITVERVEIGYFLNYDNLSGSDSLSATDVYSLGTNTAIPCYRIAVAETKQSFFVNAYNRTII